MRSVSKKYIASNHLMSFLTRLQALEVASQTLRVLRNLFFISSRFQIDVSSQYTYVYLTAIDILAQTSGQAQALLEEFHPLQLGCISPHPLDRNQDLFFLNIADHFTTVLSSGIGESLIAAAAMPYLSVNGDKRLVDIFEAAHSVMLSHLIASRNVEFIEQHIGSYSDALFQV